MKDYSFESFEELSEKFSGLKRSKQLHPITERRLALLLNEIYPNAYPRSEPGEVPGGRSDLAFYFGNGRYAVFEIFATVSQVAQDLRHLEQSNAQARIAILTDPILDDGAIFEEYFRKRPRDPFPHVKLSAILVARNEPVAKEKLRQYIDEAFVSDRATSEITKDINVRLEELGISDEFDKDFGNIRYAERLVACASRYVIFAAVPLSEVICPATYVLKTARDLLQLKNWLNTSSEDLPPRYWPPTIFDVPTSRRSDRNALIWEHLVHNSNSVLSRLVITGLAEVIFTSSYKFVSELNNQISIFKLGPILAECWRFSGLVAQLQKDIRYTDDTYLCIGMVNTASSHLGGFADGWLNPNNAEYWWHVNLGDDWSCHSPNLRFCERVILMNMKPKTQPEFIKRFAEAISVAYNYDTPRCFDKETGQIPTRYF